MINAGEAGDHIESPALFYLKKQMVYFHFKLNTSF